MARPLRDDFDGAIQHVWARGNRRERIFGDDEDYRLYLRLLAGVVVAKKWRMLAYCLMPNHVHLLVETPEANLARGMQCLHGLYARLYNDRYGHVGHVFQGRYGSKLVRDDRQFATVVRYIALNPAHADLPEAADWPWNSHTAIVADDIPGWLELERLLGFLGYETAADTARLCELVSGGLRGLG